MLYDFQKDGVRAAINKIKKHNGCIIADSVGLRYIFYLMKYRKSRDGKSSAGGW